MSKHPHSPSAGSAPSGKGEFDEEISMMILIAVVLFMLYALFKFFAWLSIYLYAPFTYVPLKLLLEKGAGAAALVFIVYAIMCVTTDYLIGLRYKGAIDKKINPERSRGFLFLAGYWVLMAVYVLLNSNPTTNNFFEMIYYICQPEDEYRPFGTCTANFESVILGSSFFSIMGKSFVPNLMFVIPLLPELLKGFVKSTDHPRNKAMGSRTVEQFINISQNNFAHLKFYSKIDPRKYSSDGNNPFALLRQSRQFATEQGLIERFIKRPDDLIGIRSIGDKQNIAETDKALTKGDVDSFIPVVDSAKFEHLMLKQLGPVWTGSIDDLTPSQIMILAIAAPQYCTIEKEMNVDEANEIIEGTRERLDDFWAWLASSVNKDIKTNDLKTWPDGYDLTRLPSLTKYPRYDKYKEELKNKWFKHPMILRVINEHAYVNTIIYEIIAQARNVGVLQPSSTRWMRLYDRSLFALVQNVGRPSVFAENMGSVSHYYAEKRNKRRLLKPEFQAAYAGFSERLSMFLYTQEDVELFKAGKLKYTIDYRDKDERFDPNNTDSDVNIKR